jgi:hypothetical protein
MQKLKGLREHYVEVDDSKWVPKKSYNSIAEIKQDLGHRYKKMHSYRCGFCNKLHTAKHPSHAKVNSS